MQTVLKASVKSNIFCNHVFVKPISRNTMLFSALLGTNGCKTYSEGNKLQFTRILRVCCYINNIFLSKTCDC